MFVLKQNIVYNITLVPYKSVKRDYRRKCINVLRLLINQYEAYIYIQGQYLGISIYKRRTLCNLLENVH